MRRRERVLHDGLPQYIHDRRVLKDHLGLHSDSREERKKIERGKTEPKKVVVERGCIRKRVSVTDVMILFGTRASFDVSARLDPRIIRMIGIDASPMNVAVFGITCTK